MMMSAPRQWTVWGADRFAFALDLRALYYLEQGRISRIGGTIDDMKVGGAYAGHDQILAFHPRIAVAR